MRQWLAAISMVAMLTAGGPQSSAADESRNTISDQSISDHVEDELLFDPAVLSTAIDVTTTDGIVSLDGSVDNLLAKERAAKLAQSVKGVRAVINEIKVLPAVTRPDRQIEKDIEAALRTDPATESYEVVVNVDDGVTTIDGDVESWQEKQLVAQVAKGVRGVTDLINNVSVDYTSDRPDKEMRREIKKALQWNVYIDHWADIDVDVQDGEVTLTGTVGSSAEKSDAIAIAWVNGVSKVNSDGLEVQDWAQDPQERETVYPDVNDKQIEQAVSDALLYDPRVKTFDIEVESTYGRVTLRGEVDNLRAKRAAASTARNTFGVNTVYNRLKVRTDERPSDAEVARSIRQALLRDPYTESYEISVEVENGMARLSGHVDSYFEKSQAEDVASRTKGVEFVDNNLLVSQNDQPYVYDPLVDRYDPYDYDWYRYDFEPLTTFRSDSEIESDIESELWWSPWVDADDVDVKVDAGRATLTGEVDSLAEKRAAAENAIEGGAVSVINNLVVQY